MESQSLLKKTVLAGIGIYSLTKEKAQELMDDLVKKGELSQDEGPKFVKAIVQKAEEEMEFLRKTIDNRVQKTLDTLKPSYENEFKKLNQRLDKLAKDIDKMGKQ